MNGIISVTADKTIIQNPYRKNLKFTITIKELFYLEKVYTVPMGSDKVAGTVYSQ